MTTAEQKPVVYATSLETAKEGETVLYYTQKVRKIVTITRTTPSIIEVGSQKFNRKGDERGQRDNIWNYTSIRVTNPTEAKDVRDTSERKQLSILLRDAKWDQFTLDQLRQVSALCLSFKPSDA
jgi:hypothetical protein